MQVSFIFFAAAVSAFPFHSHHVNTNITTNGTTTPSSNATAVAQGSHVPLYRRGGGVFNETLGTSYGYENRTTTSSNATVAA